MGWCSGTEVFDAVVGHILHSRIYSDYELIRILVEALEDLDWDCQSDCADWDHPVVRAVFHDLHPEWFKE